MIDVDLSGQRVLVIGATSGIGRVMVLEAARAGAQVVAAGRRVELLDELAAADRSVTGAACDVDDPAAARRLVDGAVEELGGLDLVVHTLGVSTLAPLADIAPEVWTQTFATNVRGPALVTQAAIPHLAEGSVVAFLSSESVGRPRRGLVHYTASKAALEEQVRGWRVEHPLLRFVRLEVGATMGTDFARDFAPDLFARCFDEWIAAGEMAEAVMVAEEVGRVLVELLAVALAHPGVDLTDVTVVPPGPRARS